MLRYECEWCNRLKKAGERWILGFAAEYRNARVKRVEYEAAVGWDDIAAKGRLAVHFCSPDHQQKYVSAILGTPPVTLPRRTATPRKQHPQPLLNNTIAGASRRSPGQRILPPGVHPAVQRAQASAIPVSESQSHPKPPPKASRKGTSRRFTAADKRFAESLGIVLESPRTSRKKK